MPVGPGVRYRVTRRGGHKIRLAIRGENTVVEAKNLDTGSTHTQSEFESEARRRLKARRVLRGKH